MVRIKQLLICYCILTVLLAQAATGSTEEIPALAECEPSSGLVVLTGEALAPLVNIPVQRLAFFRASAVGLSPITFQVDRRDEQGRYILDRNEVDALGHASLTHGDEVVLRAADAGPRLHIQPPRSAPMNLVEFRLDDGTNGASGWVYASVSAKPATVADAAQIEYDLVSDVVSSADYQIRFNSRLPFLVDTFRWAQGTGNVWSPDLVDTMKIRHQGSFLGIIPFRRTQRDYQSRLVASKAGPLRVIRRTENRVRMLWRLKTPALYIDYVVMPGGFVMDTIIDIPFNVGLFFRDIETLTTVDWNHAATLPGLTAHAPDYPHSLTIDGHMSQEKHDFNSVQSHRFAVVSTLGSIGVDLEIPPGVPITPWLYLRDARGEADPPEDQPGQFGNIGFRTTGWERIDTEVQHVRFKVCVHADR